MSNDIAIREDSELSPFKAFAADTTANAVAGDLMRFAKGNFVCGEEKQKVPLGTRFVANMDELWHGWHRWFNGKIVDHRISRVIDCAPRILRDELGNLDESLWEAGPSGEVMDPWQQVQRLVMRGADGKRKLVTFSTSSWGGRVALGKLAGEYADGRGENPVGAFPVVALAVFMQKHKQYGEIAQPRFDIVGWQMWDGGEVPSRIQPDADDPRTLIGQKIDDEIVVPGDWS